MKRRGGSRVADARGALPAQPKPCLLDVNVLIALLDPAHPFHLFAHAWFAQGRTAWATCAITQNGAIRIMSHPRYGNPEASTGVVAGLVADLCRHEGHRFWPCDLNLLDSAIVDPGRFGSAAQVTDTYLLALAVQHEGTLATFDRRLITDAVQGGREALHVIRRDTQT